MSTKQRIDHLWNQFQGAINLAYARADKTRNEEGACLRGYAENISWSDSTARLLGRETANERQHRTNRPSVPGFSNETAAKLILMQQAATGALAKELPPATAFLVIRQSAIEAQVIGFLIRDFVLPQWREELTQLDYAKLMKA